MAVSRRNGKIARSEWPVIAARAKLEPLTVIARDYGCTAPNIRYIAREHAKKNAVVFVESPTEEILIRAARRVASEMAFFIVAVDGVRSGALEPLERLRDATDGVMRCAARVLTEFDRPQNGPAASPYIR